jgi:cysteine synthase A
VPAVLDRSVADRVPVDRVHRGRTPRASWPTGRHLLSASPSGGTFAAALKVAKDAEPKGSVILAMLPDTGERYLSTFLFEGVNEGSDEEWLASLPV